MQFNSEVLPTRESVAQMVEQSPPASEVRSSNPTDKNKKMEPVIFSKVAFELVTCQGEVLSLM